MNRPHGGRRAGAGRPAMPAHEHAKTVSYSLPLSLAMSIDRVARERGITRSALVAELLGGDRLGEFA